MDLSNTIIVIVAVLLLVQPTRSAAQSPTSLPTHHREVSSYFSHEVFAARRKALAARIGNGVALVMGASTPSAYHRFRQNNTFFYLTGVEAPGAMLWINGSNGRSTLFLPEGSAMSASGPRLIPNVAAIQATGLDNVTGMEWLYLSLTSRKPDSLFVLDSPEETSATSRDGALRSQADRFNSAWDAALPRETAFIQQLKTRLPTVPIRDLTPIVDDMRWVKDSAEIRAMREGGRIAVDAFAQAIRATRRGIYEHELADVTRYVFMRRGAQGEAYFPVVASGPNSVLTHYEDNSRRIESNDLIVMDYAPDFQYETLDITRTWPASGKFNAEQVKYYNTILEAHRAIIAAVRPGVTVQDLGRIARAVYERHGMASRYPGGIGHFVGMSVHDQGPNDRPFVPGVVFNVEPMIGIPEKGWHFRLEDTILVTATGHEILTPGLPWELDDLYRLRDRGSTLELQPLPAAQPSGGRSQ
ncbi:MAG: Xaa-Pro peptidase family protein [Gemmatimonadaceae bacterium]